MKEENTVSLVARLGYYTEQAIQLKIDEVQREFDEQCERWARSIEDELVKTAKSGKNELVRFFDPRPSNEMISFLVSAFYEVNPEPLDKNGKFSITFSWEIHV